MLYCLKTMGTKLCKYTLARGPLPLNFQKLGSKEDEHACDQPST